VVERERIERERARERGRERGREEEGESLHVALGTQGPRVEEGLLEVDAPLVHVQPRLRAAGRGREGDEGENNGEEV
jgi:hypothetical protein